MISESVIIFGAKGNVVMVLTGQLPKDAAIMFKVGTDNLELMNDEQVIYTEKGLKPYVCQRLKQQNEIGILEVMDPKAPPPARLTNVAYQYA